MENALISIAGDWQDVKAVAYLHHRYTCQSKPGHIDCGAVTNGGYDCVVKMDAGCNIELTVANSPKHEDKSFVWVNIESPIKIFDIKKVKCNVEIKVTRYLNGFQLIVYGARLCWYKLTGK